MKKNLKEIMEIKKQMKEEKIFIKVVGLMILMMNKQKKELIQME